MTSSEQTIDPGTPGRWFLPAFIWLVALIPGFVSFAVYAFTAWPLLTSPGCGARVDEWMGNGYAGSLEGGGYGDERVNAAFVVGVALWAVAGPAIWRLRQRHGSVMFAAMLAFLVL